MSYRVDDVTLRDEPDDRDEAWDLLAEAGGPATLDAASGGDRLPVDALAPAIRLAHVLPDQPPE